MSVDQQLMFGTTDEDFKILMEKRNVTEQMLEEGLEQIKNWIKSQPHLCKIKPDERMLKRFLLGKTFDMSRTKSKLEQLFICRATFPEIYSNRNANNPDIINIFKVVNFSTMTKKISDNVRIHIYSFNDTNPDSFDTTALFKTMFMLSDLRTLYDTRMSDCIVVDIKGITFAHIVKILPHVSKILHISEGCYGDQITGYHILNAPDFAIKTGENIKSLMKNKMQDKLHFHRDLGSLYDLIPMEYLPADYNGTQKSCREISLQWADALKSREMTEWFSEQEKYKSDETQRKKDNTFDSNDFVGVHGTFKKLSID